MTLSLRTRMLLVAAGDDYALADMFPPELPPTAEPDFLPDDSIDPQSTEMSGVQLQLP